WRRGMTNSWRSEGEQWCGPRCLGDSEIAKVGSGHLEPVFRDRVVLPGLTGGVEVSGGWGGQFPQLHPRRGNGGGHLTAAMSIVLRGYTKRRSLFRQRSVGVG